MRYESKYKITYQQYQQLIPILKNILVKDKHVQERDSYPIFSIYFDTPDLKFYYDKVDGHYHHIKFRARKYSFDLSDDNQFFLEAKLKQNELGSKERVPQNISYKEVLNFNNWKLNKFNSVLCKTNLLPIASVFYNRLSLEDSNNLRITFDKDILAIPIGQKKVSKKDFYNNRILEEDFCLMEIKYPLKELPEYIKDILRASNVEQTSFSKYTEAVDFLQKRGIYEF